MLGAIGISEAHFLGHPELLACVAGPGPKENPIRKDEVIRTLIVKTASCT